MTDLNDRLKEVLKSEDQALISELEHESGLFELLGDTFKSRMRPWVLYMLFWSLVLTGVGVWCLVKVIYANDIDSQLNWSLGLVACLIAVAAMKVWFWLEMHKHAVVREIKRSELRLTLLLEQRSE
jgi:hypothetical protein